MEAFYAFVDNLSGFIWGGSWGSTQILPFAPLAVFLLGSGLYFMIRLGGRPLRRFGPALAELCILENEEDWIAGAEEELANAWEAAGKASDMLT